MSPYKSRDMRLKLGARYRASRTPEQKAEAAEYQRAWTAANPGKRSALARVRRAKLLAELLANPDHKKHGTLTAANAGCKCLRCVTARRNYEQLQRDKKKAAKS